MLNDDAEIFEDFIEIISGIVAAEEFESHFIQKANTVFHFSL